MTGAVVDVIEVVRRVAKRLENEFDNLLVVEFAVGPNEVGIANSTLINDRPHRRVVIEHVDPVAHVEAGAVQTWLDAIDQVRHRSRDELLDVLVGAVVVRAVGDRGRDSETANPCAHEVI